MKDKKEAFICITEGRVFVNGQKAISPAQMIKSGARIEVRGGPKYVGRGAFKLEAALDKFNVDVIGKVCADIGAATGGFTEVLLKHGAKKVYAIDTARGKLALKLRANPRVVVREHTDVRYLQELPDPIEIATIDVSLIPLQDVLPHVRRFLSSRGSVIALFKPQYQTRDRKLLKRGIITDASAREELLENFTQWAEERGWKVKGSVESPIRGSEGNIEYLLHLSS